MYEFPDRQVVLKYLCKQQLLKNVFHLVIYGQIQFLLLGANQNAVKRPTNQVYCLGDINVRLSGNSGMPAKSAENIKTLRLFYFYK